MIVKPPKDDYEKQIYNICLDIPKLPGGEKAIIYDLATQWIPDRCYVDFKFIDLETYINDIIIIYNKYKSSPIINLVNTFIKQNNFEKKVNNKTYLGGNNDTSKDITIQQRYWFGEFD